MDVCNDKESHFFYNSIIFVRLPSHIDKFVVSKSNLAQFVPRIAIVGSIGQSAVTTRRQLDVNAGTLAMLS